jgi:hypothetical protein
MCRAKLSLNQGIPRLMEWLHDGRSFSKGRELLKGSFSKGGSQMVALKWRFSYG